MYQVSAHAVRQGKTIEVTVFGQLANTCHQASIEDIYPGGKRVYITDPGAAQVFVSDTVKPGSQMCLMMLVPWGATVEIPDREHKKVEIFVNNVEVLEVEVNEKKSSKFIVIGPIVEDLGGCSILPENSFYPAIYKKVFGPASYDECAKYAEEKCSAFRNTQMLSKERELVSSSRK